MKKVVKFQKKEKPNHKKVFTIAGIVAVVIIAITIMVVYQSNKEFRTFMDKYVFRKNVTEENVPMIEIDYDSNTNVIPYDKYICILAENTLFQYNSSGKKEKEIKVEISNPVYDSEGKYLAIGEKDNQKLYLITGDHVVWEKNIEGNLSKVSVNKNGYVSIIVTGTTHKTVIVTYDSKGKELFKVFLSSTIAVDAEISPDNNYLAYAEVNTSGTMVQSNVKIISMEEAKEEDTKPKYTYNAPQNVLAIRIKYQDKNQLVCMFEDSICVIKDGIDSQILELSDASSNITFADIELNNYVFRSVENSKGLFSADTMFEIKHVNGQKESVYTVEEVAKSVVSKNNVIAINLGTEVDFIDTNGWLIKHYTSSQVIRNIVICENVAGIIYRDKIELISL